MSDNASHTLPPVAPSEGIRKLAAIMFTDIKDFSKKMQRNEDAAMRMLAAHNRMMHEVVQKYRGKVVKTIGDAFLVSFESVVDATSCAIEAQQNFLEYNTEKGADEKITVRIGVHLGDVIIKEKDVFGDGVNIASRVQSMAEPGGLNITESVYQQVKNKLDIHVVKLGVPQLKGIKEAVRVYQVIIVPTAKTRGKLATQLYVTRTILKRKRSKQILASSAALVLLALWAWSYFTPREVLNSLAVLPFENLGPAEQEYLSDGLSEDIISQLSRIPEVLVISKSSSFAYKGSKLDERTIARELGVQYLLKGNVRTIAEQVIVLAFLVEGATGRRVSTQNYVVKQDEISQLQYEIPRQIGQTFKLQFAAKVQTTTPEVYELYSRGLFERGKLEREGNLAAVGMFSSAIAKDSSFVPAIVALAKAYIQSYDYGWEHSEQTLVLAEQNCQRALRSDSTSAEALAILGKISLSRGERDWGLKLLDSALYFDSRNYMALAALGREYLFNMNNPAAGISYWQRALETEPTNFVLASNIGVGYGMLKNFPEAIVAFRRASMLNPSHDYPFINLAIAFERSALYDSALSNYRIAVSKNPMKEENYLFWGELLLALKHHARAESVFTAGIRQVRENNRLLYDLGVAHHLQGTEAAAKAAWQQGLQAVKSELQREPSSPKHLPYAALFSARLKKEKGALSFMRGAISRDSTDSELIFSAARVYAVLGKKKEMLGMFRKARSMNPDYDVSYLKTAIDFENYRDDPALLAVLREQ